MQIELIKPKGSFQTSDLFVVMDIWYFCYYSEFKILFHTTPINISSVLKCLLPQYFICLLPQYFI